MKSTIKRITNGTMIVGIDIAKRVHWARMTDSRGIDLIKPFKINNNIMGFESLLAEMDTLREKHGLSDVIVGMEPSGHYWKTIGWFLKTHEITLVGVNPYHVKQLKELDDNSKTKSDKKDAYVIACLIRDGRFFDIYLAEREYADLRNLNRHRQQICDKKKWCMNTLIAIMDEYFPEYETGPFSICCPTSRKFLSAFPFPSDIRKYRFDDFFQVVNSLDMGKRLGKKRTKELYDLAESSIGVTEGLPSCRQRINDIIAIMDLLEKQISCCEHEMNVIMERLDLSPYLTSIPGVGDISSAMFIAETGDLSRFSDWKQIQKLAGLNLTEQSSGQHKGKTTISKRGRPGLRHILYMIGDKGMLVNPEMRQYYNYLRKRASNQLSHVQALLAVGLKLLRVMFHVAKYKEVYDPFKVLGEVRMQQISGLNAA